MDLRTLMVGAAVATGLAGVAYDVRADIVAGENGISVQSSDVPTPSRGMTMSQVASKFGEPTTKVPAVGNPPISRWDYPGFVVYFERDYVIHSVVSSSAPPASQPAAAAPQASAVPALSIAPAEAAADARSVPTAEPAAAPTPTAEPAPAAEPAPTVERSAGAASAPAAPVAANPPPAAADASDPPQP
jgi:hypothetical protein